jgi:multidrug efflux pump subunit AcrB
MEVGHGIAEKIRGLAAAVRGTADVRIQQKIDYPMLDIDVDRVRAAYVGLTPKDVVTNVVTALNSSINFDPAFWIDERNGNHYFIGAQYAEEAIRSVETLENIPIRGSGQERPVFLKNVATIRRRTGPAEINHVNITRVTDVFANVDGRDVGGVAAEIRARLEKEIVPHLPEGYFVHLRGEVASMQESFRGLGFGFLLAVVLIFLVMVAQFRSFLDPFIVMFAVPLGLIGVVAVLLLTGTTLNVQSILGVIFMVGIVVSNSILLVEFANRLLRQGVPLRRAILEAAAIRLRPILMTSIAAILALLPMAFGLGRGTEANVPLARAVVGGLLVSTLLTLFVVPCLMLILKRRAGATL